MFGFKCWNSNVIKIVSKILESGLDRKDFQLESGWHLSGNWFWACSASHWNFFSWSATSRSTGTSQALGHHCRFATQLLLFSVRPTDFLAKRFRGQIAEAARTKLNQIGVSVAKRLWFSICLAYKVDTIEQISWSTLCLMDFARAPRPAHIGELRWPREHKWRLPIHRILNFILLHGRRGSEREEELHRHLLAKHALQCSLQSKIAQSSSLETNLIVAETAARRSAHTSWLFVLLDNMVASIRAAWQEEAKTSEPFRKSSLEFRLFAFRVVRSVCMMDRP